MSNGDIAQLYKDGYGITYLLTFVFHLGGLASCIGFIGYGLFYELARSIRR